MRIAMWSGPRNLSTAMMYAFAARGDSAVMDEPFYAAYLAETGMDHPMRDAVISDGLPDPRDAAALCAGPVPGGKDHLYMKHMAHHMTDRFPLDWATACVNIHLIRHPARVIASYGVKRQEMTLEDIGFPQQLALFQRFGGHVIDSADIRENPETALRGLCDSIGLPYTSAMLSWEAGPKPFDGIWAAHWYDAVHRSTGFAGAEGPLPELDGTAAKVMAEAMPYYEAMRAAR